MEKTGVTGVWELRFERTGLSWDRAVDRLSLGIHPPEDTYLLFHVNVRKIDYQFPLENLPYDIFGET